MALSSVHSRLRALLAILTFHVPRGDLNRLNKLYAVTDIPHSYPLADTPLWTGPPAVNGHLASAEDPFVSDSLAGGAPAFVPATSNDQSGGPGSGSSSPPGGEPADGGSSNGPSADGRPSSGSSGNISGGRTNSSNSNGQGSDRSEPVIVVTPHGGGKVKQSQRPQTPSSRTTRFLRTENVFAADFEENKPLGRVKALVSIVQP